MSIIGWFAIIATIAMVVYGCMDEYYRKQRRK